MKWIKVFPTPPINKIVLLVIKHAGKISATTGYLGEEFQDDWQYANHCINPECNETGIHDMDDIQILFWRPIDQLPKKQE